MKKIIYLFLVLQIVQFSCQKDEIQSDIQLVKDELVDDQLKKDKDKDKEKISICHFDSILGLWKLKETSLKGLNSHLSHGDVELIDADGDG